MVTWNLRDVIAFSLGAKAYQEFDIFGPDGRSAPIRQFPDVSSINMFVGANHSGKSRFLRALARDAELTSVMNAKDPHWASLRASLTSSIAALQHLNEATPWARYDAISGQKQYLYQLLATLKALGQEKGIPCQQEKLDQFRWISSVVKQLEEPLKQAAIAARASRDVGDPIHFSHLQGALHSLQQHWPEEPFGKMPEFIYLPVLRGLRLFQKPQSAEGNPADPYSSRTRDDYFKERQAVQIFTGYTLYHRVRDMLLGRQDERRRVRDYEKFLSEQFFENKEVTLTPHRDGVLHVTIDGEEQAIHDVGDGLQSAIILTFEPFVRRDEPCLFFIEEPEMFLHPGLQRHILEFFLHCEKHLFFFTTHSNHFLGMSFDYEGISIYNFQRNASASESDKPRFIITPVSRGHHSSLELLGVRNSSVFLVNATIWVEGVTDRRYLRKFLELYREHCKSAEVPPEEDIRRLEEDLHYAFVEYGGANLPHWSFSPASDDASAQTSANERPIEVRTLCARAIVIRDDDETSTSDGKKGKHRQNELLKGDLGERILLTPGREIENLLPPPVIAAIMQQKVPAAQPETWTRADYRDQRLGKFLDEKTGATGTWGGRYGTLKQKTEFCTKAIQQIDELRLTFADLDDEVREMVRRICRFLVEQNRFAVVPHRS